MDQLESFSAVIDTIYRGATDVCAWPRIVEAVARWMNVPKAVMFTPFHPPHADGFVFPYGISQAHVEAWAHVKQSSDLWALRSIERGLAFEGNIVLDSDLTTRDELLSSAWYQDFLRHQDIGQLMSGIVFGFGGMRLPLTGFSLFRSLDAPAFAEADRARFQLLLPHLSRALGVLLTLRDAELRVASTRSALDRLGSGVLLFGADGAVTHANHAAQQILAAGDGLSWFGPPAGTSGRLWIHDEATRVAMQQAVQAALQRHTPAQHFKSRILVERPSGKPPYALLVSSLSDQAEFGLLHSMRSAIAFIIHPDRLIQLDGRTLTDIYGLTAAEARVALAMLEEDDVQALAERLNVARTTVKTHISKVYDKMGVSSRGSLVRTLLSHADP